MSRTIFAKTCYCCMTSAGVGDVVCKKCGKAFDPAFVCGPSTPTPIAKGRIQIELRLAPDQEAVSHYFGTWQDDISQVEQLLAAATFLNNVAGAMLKQLTGELKT